MITPNMRATRFYRPAPAQLTGRELMFAGESLDDRYRLGTELDVPDFDFAAPSSQYHIMTRRTALHGNNKPGDFVPEFFDMGPFQITYNFSRAIRKNTFMLKSALPYRPKVKGEYGASGWSFRMLYEFLCITYNGGYPFVDTYFNQIFKTRPEYAVLKEIYEDIQADINAEQTTLYEALPRKKDGTPDMRYSAYKKYKDFKVWRSPIVKQNCKRVAEAIRRDIVVCLSTGRIPLRKQTISRQTKKAREEFIGLNPSLFFFASGQLIKHLNIYVEVGKAA